MNSLAHAYTRPRLRIYCPASFRNLPGVSSFQEHLRNAGHHVLDWTRHAPPLPKGMPASERRLMLDQEGGPRRKIFDFCTASCARNADLVIYFGPAGQDAACEVGIAWQAGKTVYGIAGPLEEPGLILNGCVHMWFDTIQELLTAVEDFAGPYTKKSTGA